jgi:RNA polymerase sigma factor (sigma-70 family)
VDFTPIGASEMTKIVEPLHSTSVEYQTGEHADDSKDLSADAIVDSGDNAISTSKDWLDYVENFPHARISTHMPRHSKKPWRMSQRDEATLAYLAQQELPLQKARIDLTHELGRSPKAKEWAVAALGESGTVHRLGVILKRAREAKSRLVCAHSGLVRKAAYAYQARKFNEPLDDLIQEGTIGLMRAVDKFDGSRGNRFSTYATQWINAYIIRWLKQDLIHVPEGVRNLGNKAIFAKKTLEEDLGRDPTPDEVARNIGVHELALTSAVNAVASTQVVSYDSRHRNGANSEVDRSLVDLIPDRESEAEQVDGDLNIDLAYSLASVLTEKELNVIRLRFGLSDGNPRFVSQCASKLGISPTQVSRLCNRALRKLREKTEDKSRWDEHHEALLNYMHK